MEPATTSPPALRLFVGDDPAPIAAPSSTVDPPGDTKTLSPTMTLGEFYEAYVEPNVLRPRQIKQRTLDQYQQSLGYWQKLTSDPPLASIDGNACSEFVCRVAKLHGRDGEPISPNTVRKHCVHLQRVIDLAGPKRRACRMAAELLDSVPYLERPPKREEEVENVFTLDEISAWLEACKHAAVPQLGVEPALWWRALIIWIYNVGTRIETTLLLEWSMIQGDELVVPARIIKGNNGKRFPLNEAALRAAESVRTANKRLFFWPHGHSWLQENRRRILAKTEIPPERRFGFHAVRKLLGTTLWEDDPAAAEKMLGHLGRDVTRRHYVHRKVVRKAIDKVPQPAIAADDPQLTLPGF